MKAYLPRVGWEKFECFSDGTLIDPQDKKAMDEAFMFRWAFVVGWGDRVWRAWVMPKDEMQRL